MVCRLPVPTLEAVRTWEAVPTGWFNLFVNSMNQSFGPEKASRLWHRFVSTVHDGILETRNGELPMKQACKAGIEEIAAALNGVGDGPAQHLQEIKRMML